MCVNIYIHKTVYIYVCVYIYKDNVRLQRM